MSVLTQELICYSTGEIKTATVPEWKIPRPIIVTQQESCKNNGLLFFFSRRFRVKEPHVISPTKSIPLSLVW